jgi:hypothetical protein
MHRFLIFAGCLFLALSAFSAYGDENYLSRPEAQAACTAAASGDDGCNNLGNAIGLIRGPFSNRVLVKSFFYGHGGSVCAAPSTYNSSTRECNTLAPPAPVCTSNTIPGFGLYGSNSNGDTIVIGDTGPRIANVDACAYTCYVDYSLLDGNTSFADAHQCTGLSQPFVDQEPGSYTDPDVCAVRSNLGECLELAQQSGPCASGTTYGRVNDIEVCVPSGTSTAAADEGSTGVPDAGGSQQATGTADSAGTGGLSTGSGTSTGSSSSTTTDNGDGTSSTTGESTEESTGPATFGGHGDPASWWVSKYPEGASGIGQNFAETIQSSALIGILSPLDTLPEGGSAPVWSMNFNLGPMGNFGSMSYELPNGFWLFIKFCVLFTAAMTCRALIFGG